MYFVPANPPGTILFFVFVLIYIFFDFSADGEEPDESQPHAKATGARRVRVAQGRPQQVHGGRGLD